MTRHRLIAMTALPLGALVIGLAAGWLARPTPATMPTSRATKGATLAIAPVPTPLSTPVATPADPPPRTEWVSPSIVAPAAPRLIRAPLPRATPVLESNGDHVTITTTNSW